MSPALFLGWRVDSGGRYRNVVKVLDYQDFRIRGLSQSIDVPEPELYVEDGPPVFPVAHARHQALLEGKPARSDDEVPSLPEIDLKEVPFPPEGEGIAAPPTPSAKKPQEGFTLLSNEWFVLRRLPVVKGALVTALYTPQLAEQDSPNLLRKRRRRRGRSLKRKLLPKFSMRSRTPQHLQKKKKLLKLNCSSQNLLFPLVMNMSHHQRKRGVHLRGLVLPLQQVL